MAKRKKGVSFTVKMSPKEAREHYATVVRSAEAVVADAGDPKEARTFVKAAIRAFREGRYKDAEMHSVKAVSLVLK